MQRFAGRQTGVGPVVAALGEVRIQAQGFVIEGDRLFDLALFIEHGAQGVPEHGRLRLGVDHRTQQFDRFFKYFNSLFVGTLCTDIFFRQLPDVDDMLFVFGFCSHTLFRVEPLDDILHDSIQFMLGKKA